MVDTGSFDKVLVISHKLLQIQDLDLLLESLLGEAIAAVGADAGSIYLAEGSALKFSYTQNATLQKKLSLGKKLIYSRFKIAIDNHSLAGYVANNGISLNVGNAYEIPPFQPYSFDKSFDEETGYQTRSVLTIPIKFAGNKTIGVIQLINALNASGSIRAFTATDESIVQFLANHAAVIIERAQTTRSMILIINKMIAVHAPQEQVEHASQVAAYATEIYEAWALKKGISKQELEHNRDTLRIAAMLHDIGKIAVPSEILAIPQDQLTQEQLQLKCAHTIKGAMILSNQYSELESIASEVALNHHENWDGSGYPGHIDPKDGSPLPGYEKAPGQAFGKIGVEIPLYARIVAVANTYDIIANRPDQADGNVKKQQDQAVKEILSSSGSKFDPEVVTAFAGCLDILFSLTNDYDQRKL